MLMKLLFRVKGLVLPLNSLFVRQCSWTIGSFNMDKCSIAHSFFPFASGNMFEVKCVLKSFIVICLPMESKRSAACGNMRYVLSVQGCLGPVTQTS